MIYKNILGFVVLSALMPNIFASTTDDDIYIADEIVARIGMKAIYNSDVIVTYYQYKQKDPLIKKKDIINTMCDEALLLTEAKHVVKKIDKFAIDSTVNRQMNYIMDKLNYDTTLFEKYLGKKTHAFRKDLIEKAKERYILGHYQSELSANFDINDQYIRKYYQYLVDNDQVPVNEDSYEIYQLVLKQEESDEASDLINDIKDKLNEGADFDEMIDKYSEDKNNSEDVCYTFGDMNDEYEKAVFKLKNNEISDVVKAEKGYYIIQLIEKKDNTYRTKHIFIKNTYKDISKSLEKINDIRQDIMDRKITWNAAIDKYVPEEFRAYDGLITYGYNKCQDYCSLSFDVTKIINHINIGEISKPTVSNNGQYVKILYLRKIIKAHPLTLEQDYEQIKDMAQEYYRNKYMDYNIRKIKEKLEITRYPSHVK